MTNHRDREPSRALALVPSVPDPEARRAARMANRADRFAPPLDPDTAELVLMHLANGVRITQLDAVPGAPPYAVVNAWRNAHPWFDEACVQASEANAERMLYDIIEIADDQQRAPACREVSIRARQWAQRVLHRKRFDPAVKVEVSESRAADTLSNAELERIVAQAIGPGLPGEPPAGATGGAKT